MRVSGGVIKARITPSLPAEAQECLRIRRRQASPSYTKRERIL